MRPALAPPKLVVAAPEASPPTPVTPGPAIAEELRKSEALKARKAHHLLESIRSVERFTGEPRELELFLDEMEAVHGLITHTKIDATIDQDIWRVFVSRMSRQVLMDTGLRYSSSWEEIKVSLKERYAGAKKPVARDTLSLLRMNRRSGESGAEFGQELAPVEDPLLRRDDSVAGNNSPRGSEELDDLVRVTYERERRGDGLRPWDCKPETVNKKLWQVIDR
jgi:hypothetical protein